MKIAFWGTPPFTTQFLDVLTSHDLTPSLIITTPDKPVGRGMTLQSPAPKIWGDQHTITVVQPERIDEQFIELIQKEQWDLFIVVAYGKLLPESVIALPKFGTINVHYSLLPNYRGATPVESAILNGDATTGITIQQMQFKLDSGPILAQKEISIAPDDTTVSLRDKLNTEALVLLPDVIGGLVAGITSPLPQDENLKSSCKKISKEDGEISLSDDPTLLDRKYRAYTPWPGLYFFVERKEKKVRIKITKAHSINGTFIIDEVIPENSKAMSFVAYEQWLKS